MWCEHCQKDADHGTGNCPVERLSLKSDPAEKNKTILLRKKDEEFVTPPGKVLISQELYEKLMEFSARLDVEREAHTKYMREYRARKAHG